MELLRLAKTHPLGSLSLALSLSIALSWKRSSGGEFRNMTSEEPGVSGADVPRSEGRQAQRR